MKRKGSSFLRLLGYECRKAFWTPVMLIFLMVLLCMNGWRIADSFRQADRWKEYGKVYSAFYNGYVGEITEEKWTHLTTIYSPLKEKADTMSLSYEYSPDAYTYSEGTDYAFFTQRFYDQMAYDRSYGENAAAWSVNARKFQKLYKQAGNTYGISQMKTLEKTFEGRVISNFTETWSWEVLLTHDYSAMLVLLLSIFALSGVFVTERETDMMMLLRTTQKGGGATVGAKLTAAMLYTLCACILFFGEDFLIVFLMSRRTQALSSPVYTLRFFRMTPLTMTLGQYFLWAAVVKTLGIFFCGWIILLISSLAKQSLTAFFLSFGVLTGCVVLREFSGCAYLLKAFNPMELVVPRDLVRECTFCNFFEMAVPLHIIVLLGCAALALILLGGILYTSRSYHRRARRRNRHAEI